MSEPETILAFWFGEPAADADSLKQKIRRWYGGGPAYDRELHEKFADDLELARRGELAAWAATPRGRLALVLLLDQCSRNIHRGTPRAFDQDRSAQTLVLEAMEAGWERDLSLDERMFLTMPLVHAEDPALQERAVRSME